MIQIGKASSVWAKSFRFLCIPRVFLSCLMWVANVYAEQEGEWSSYVSSSSWVTYGSEVESGSEITMGGDVTDTPVRGQKFIHHHHHHVHHHHHNEHDPHHRHHRHIKRHKLHHHTQIDLVFITSFLIPLLRCQITPRKIYRFFFVASPHQELFWLNAPALYLYLVQLMLLFNVSLGVFAAVALSGLLKVPWQWSGSNPNQGNKRQ